MESMNYLQAGRCVRSASEIQNVPVNMPFEVLMNHFFAAEKRFPNRKFTSSATRIPATHRTVTRDTAAEYVSLEI